MLSPTPQKGRPERNGQNGCIQRRSDIERRDRGNETLRQRRAKICFRGRLPLELLRAPLPECYWHGDSVDYRYPDHHLPKLEISVF